MSAATWAVPGGYLALFLGLVGSVEAGEPMAAPRIYDGVDAAWDSHFRAEAGRRESLGRQLETNDAMAWYAGAPTYAPYPPDLETVYAYPPGAFRGIWGASPTSIYRSYPGVFEPWPLVPGDIYGYPYVNRIEQPRGHVVIPYGRSSYYYGPVYDRDLAPVFPGNPNALPEPPTMVNPPVTQAPAELVPRALPPEPIPAPQAEPGPQEF